ncbi:hypothetical protein [Proteus genomosp. 4]|uniref:hypothetical protein n=1 Tax=Proteus genomosp. 4 TaxID=1311818 RepID=UPI000D689E06|nr:hypothetical protein [Proteus genomosp. 4]
MIFSNVLNKLKEYSKTLIILFSVFGIIVLYKGCSGEERTYYRIGEIKAVNSCGQYDSRNYLCGLDIYDTSTKQLLSNEMVGLKSQPYVGHVLFSQCIVKGSSVSCSKEWRYIRS